MAPRDSTISAEEVEKTISVARQQYSWLREQDAIKQDTQTSNVAKWAFFENAGGSQVPDVVAEAIQNYFKTACSQLGGNFPLSHKSTKIWQDAHTFSNVWMNGTDVGETILGANTSSLLYVLANCYAKILKAGDEIILDEGGHEANIGPWLHLESQGIVLKWWKVNPETGLKDINDLDDLLTQKTKIVAVAHVSNILGVVEDLSAISAKAHAVGAKVVADGVAYAPHALIDVKAWGVDWYVFSYYKVYGPHMAAMFGRHENLKEIYDTKATPNWFFIPTSTYLFEVGSLNYECCNGIIALRNYLATFLGVQPENVDRQAIERALKLFASAEEFLQERILSYLTSKPNVHIVGTTESSHSVRVPTISFFHNTITSANIVQALVDAGVAAKNGHMYAYRLVKALKGVHSLDDGVVRLSLVHYNTAEEVDRAIAALDKVL